MGLMMEVEDLPADGVGQHGRWPLVITLIGAATVSLGLWGLLLWAATQAVLILL